MEKSSTLLLEYNYAYIHRKFEEDPNPYILEVFALR